MFGILATGSCSQLLMNYLYQIVLLVPVAMSCYEGSVLVKWHMPTELQSQNTHMGESPSVAQMQNQQNRDQQYLAVRVGSGQQALNIDSASYKTDSAGNHSLEMKGYFL
jgi:hypothetical protein